MQGLVTTHHLYQTPGSPDGVARPGACTVLGVVEGEGEAAHLPSQAPAILHLQGPGHCDREAEYQPLHVVCKQV